MSDQPVDRRAEAIAQHAWMIACYIRGVTEDPVRQDEAARGIGNALVAALSIQRSLGVEPE